ncbi:MAG: methyltransferase domain-containing protein [Chloroflexota bacterium]|nr:methyltransferase domain-containing protein [Chloroflexota bacterium]
MGQGLHEGVACHGPAEVVGTFVAGYDANQEIHSLELVSGERQTALGVHGPDLGTIDDIEAGGEIYNVVTIETRLSPTSGVEVLVAAAEALPFDEDAFDAALSRLVVNFMRDPETGVFEMMRVTRAGGVVASCVWDHAGEMTLLRAFWDAAREVDPERAAAADEGVAMRWCGDGDLGEQWRLAGLRDTQVECPHLPEPGPTPECDESESRRPSSMLR